MRRGVILINAYTQSESELNQPRRLQEELERLGVRADIVRNAFLDVCGGQKTEGADFCVYLDKDKYAARRLEGQSMRLFNRARVIEDCDDKALTCLRLTGVPMPKTIAAPLCYTRGAEVREEWLDGVEQALGYPMIVKECYGSLGKGVYLVETRAQLEEAASALQRKPHLFQRFVAESRGKDVRAIVIGGKVVCAMKRTSVDFRSNIELGGKGEPFTLDKAAEALCTEIARRLGADYCGIDLLFGKEGFLLCEVNSNAFFGGAERVTGVNVARRYAEHIVNEIYGGIS